MRMHTEEMITLRLCAAQARYHHAKAHFCADRQEAGADFVAARDALSRCLEDLWPGQETGQRAQVASASPASDVGAGAI